MWFSPVWQNENHSVNGRTRSSKSPIWLNTISDTECFSKRRESIRIWQWHLSALITVAQRGRNLQWMCLIYHNFVQKHTYGLTTNCNSASFLIPPNPSACLSPCINISGAYLCFNRCACTLKLTRRFWRMYACVHMSALLMHGSTNGKFWLQLVQWQKFRWRQC